EPGGWRPMAGAGGETPGCSSTWPFPSATSTSWGSPGSPRDLNSSNRPVRTRMPGGVAGVPRDYLGPLCRLGRLIDGVLVKGRRGTRCRDGRLVDGVRVKGRRWERGEGRAAASGVSTTGVRVKGR